MILSQNILWYDTTSNSSALRKDNNPSEIHLRRNYAEYHGNAVHGTVACPPLLTPASPGTRRLFTKRSLSWHAWPHLLTNTSQEEPDCRRNKTLRTATIPPHQECQLRIIRIMQRSGDSDSLHKPWEHLNLSWSAGAISSSTSVTYRGISCFSAKAERSAMCPKTRL